MWSITARGRGSHSGAAGLAPSLGGALLLMALVPSGAWNRPPEPRGVVEEPRLQTFSVSPARATTFLFQGRVDFPGSQGSVRIDVLENGNGDANDAGNWAIEVATGLIDETPTVIGGEEWFLWSTQEPVAIFQGEDPTQERWPEGGTARVRFVASRTNPDGSESHTVLPVLDKQGVEGFSTELILADSDPRPTSPGRSNPDYLNRKPALGPADTARYYSTVRTNPIGKGPTIASSLRTLIDFEKRYFVGAVGATQSAEAVYFNRGDLGLGRDMHCSFRRQTLETACFVKNLGRRDGTPLFGDMAESFEALFFDKPFATVGMVERGRMSAVAPNRVFFVVYDAKGQLALQARLDNKGFNKFIPGNCLVCHGSGGSFKATTAEVTGAYFLPFDLSSFRYYGVSFLIGKDLTREHQEPDFKVLNQLVLGTDLRNLDHARELIEGWYGGPGLPRETFDDEFVPQGWNQDENISKLYRKVVARTCRSCHISHPGALSFGTLEEFSALKTTIHFDACQIYAMPNAEQTLDLFWKSSARPHLLNRLPIQFGCGLPPSTLGRVPPPDAANSNESRSALRVIEDYKTQSCACATKQCLQVVEGQFLGVIAALGPIAPAERERTGSLVNEAVACRLRALDPDR
jgi:hypothetical protein